MLSCDFHVVLNTISIGIVDGDWLEWSEISGETEEFKIFRAVNELHVVVEFSFSFHLEVLFIVIAIRDVLVTVTVDQVWNLNEGFLWSVSEWSSPVMGWLWIITKSIVTGEFSVLGVMDVIDVVSISISFDLI